MTSLAVCIDYDDPLIQSLILSSLQTNISNFTTVRASEASLQWSTYESLSFEHILSNPSTTLCNSYIFRKALIRKHFLSNTVQQWLSKNSNSILAKSVPKTYLLDCDYAEYLDEALNESFELRDALQSNEDTREERKKWFILKPSMADRGQGIRLFSSLPQLEEIFEEFEQLDDDENTEDEGSNTGVIANQLRYFVVQEYIPNPLLLSSIRLGRKFHLRAYVVAFGAIKVFVWSEILALFAGQTYSPPSESADMDAHLTNTCLQTGEDKDDNVLRFWDLPLEESVLVGVFKKVCDVTGEIFVAAAQGQQMHFQTLPNAFEIFGLDFLVDSKHNVYLLEVNSYPDFKQTGEKLTHHVVGGLFQEVTKQIICPFFDITPKTETEGAEVNGDGEKGWKKGWLELVKDIRLRGNW